MDPKAPQRGIYIPPAKKSRWDDPKMRWGVIGLAGLVVLSGIGVALVTNFGSETAYIEIYITDAPTGFDEIVLELVRVEVGEAKHRLPILNERFDILKQEGPADPLRVAAGEVPAGEYKSLALGFARARGYIGDTAFEFAIAKPILQVSSEQDMAASGAGALLIDLDMAKSVCVGPTGFIFCPTVEAVYFQDLAAKDPAGRAPSPQRDGFQSEPVTSFQQESKKDETIQPTRNPFSCTSICDSSGSSTSPSPTGPDPEGPDLVPGNPFGEGLNPSCGLPDDPTEAERAQYAVCDPIGFLALVWDEAAAATNSFIVEYVPEQLWAATEGLPIPQGPPSLAQQMEEQWEVANDALDDHAPGAQGTVEQNAADAGNALHGAVDDAGLEIPTEQDVEVPDPGPLPMEPDDASAGAENPGAVDDAEDTAGNIVAGGCAVGPAQYALVQQELSALGVTVVGSLCNIAAVVITTPDNEVLNEILDGPYTVTIYPNCLCVQSSALDRALEWMGWTSLNGIDPSQAINVQTLPFTGQGSTIGILDTAVFAAHPDLNFKKVGVAIKPEEAFIANWQTGTLPCQTLVVAQDWFIPSQTLSNCLPANPTVPTPPQPGVNAPTGLDLVSGHGTMVSGVVAGRPAAVAAPGTETAIGAAPGAHLIGYGMAQQNVQTSVSTDSLTQGLLPTSVAYFDLWTAARALDFAVTDLRNGADITAFTASWGIPSHRYLPGNPVADLVELIAGKYETPIVFAAGNDGADAGFDNVNGFCRSPRTTVLCVAAYDIEGGRSRAEAAITGFSSRPLLDPATHTIDLAMPGVRIRTTAPPGAGTYADFTGTSAAAPLVAGCIALIHEAAPDLTGPQIANLLIQTAYRGFEPTMMFRPYYDGSRPPLSGDAGHGLGDCEAAVLAAQG